MIQAARDPRACVAITGDAPNNKSFTRDMVGSCSNSWPTKTMSGLEPGARAYP